MTVNNRLQFDGVIHVHVRTRVLVHARLSASGAAVNKSKKPHANHVPWIGVARPPPELCARAHAQMIMSTGS